MSRFPGSILLEGKPTEADKTKAVERIREVAGELGVRLMTQEEPAEFTAEFERTSLFIDAGFSPVEPWDFDASIANSEREWSSLYVIAAK